MGEVWADLAAVPRWTPAAVRQWLHRAEARWRVIAPTLSVAHVAGAAAVSTAGDSTAARDRYVGEHERFAAMLTGDAGRWRGVPPAQARQRALMAVLQTESFLNAWIAAGLPMDTDDPLDLLAGSLCHLLGPALVGRDDMRTRGEERSDRDVE